MVALAIQKPESNALNDFMDLCLAQARLASPNCLPNPAVGAVIVGVDGSILGIGHTQAPGEAHAEIEALRQAQSRGHDVKGSTIYVTLEPCAHYGRTGPCALALINAQISKVVASTEDPNPKVSGKGFQMLRDAGIEVVIGPGADDSKEINIGFFSRFIREIPWVRLKVASSIDGRTALLNGESKWITDETARSNGRAWRARASAILTGIGTILKDNPRLDTRGEPTTREPLLAVVDSNLNTPPDANIFLAPRSVVIFTASKCERKRADLETAGASIIYAPDTLTGKVCLKTVLAELARREVGELHVEAGATLNGTLIRAGLVDELIWYVAPKLLGAGAPIADIGTLQDVANSPQFRFSSVSFIGNDLCIVARNKSNDFSKNF